HEFHYLHAQSLARELVETVATLNTRCKAGGIGVIARAICCVKTEKAQDAQVVLGDALCRIADEAHSAVAEIGEPTGIVVDRAVARCRQRVNREISPLGIRLPVAAKFNLGMATVGLYILAKRCHLEGMFVDDDGDGAVLDPGRHVLKPCSRHSLYHVVRYS